MSKLIGIQYLRALAALMVVGFHSASREGYMFHLGEAGVDLFFVLSGFLMVAITSDETRPVAFMLDRIKRIVPLYWIATTFMLLGAVAGIFPSLDLTFWHVTSSYLFIPSVSPGSGELWPLLVPGWTLNYEMAFYAIFSSLMILRVEAARVAVLVGALFALVLVGYSFPSGAPAVSFYTNPIVLEFGIGAFIGLLWKKGRFQGSVGFVPLALGALLFAVVGSINTAQWRVFIFGVPAGLVLIGVLSLETSGRIRHWKLPLLLGDASYSIYLWHGVALSVAAKLGVVLGLSSGSVVVFGLIFGTAFGLMAYFLIEKPILAAFNRRRYVRGVPIPSGP